VVMVSLLCVVEAEGVVVEVEVVAITAPTR
jgi:hypothetical protein